MEVMCNNFMPGDSRLVEKLVSELKSQGIFDQFRKECISDVDTKPAYQNLRQRVEGSVSTFLKGQNWSVELNKNQLREQLRKNLQESGFLETGVERIVDQVVNPKINTVFLPKVEEVVYKFLGLENPNRNMKREPEVPVPDPLPTDLETISPGSVQGEKLDLKKADGYLLMNPTETNVKLEDDEKSFFDSHPLDSKENGSEKMNVDENTRDSHLSGFSGLESHGSNLGSDNRIFQMDISNQDSQISQNSSESHLSIITSDDTSKMDISEDSNTILKSEKAEVVVEDEENISPEYEPIDKETVKLDKYENKFDVITKESKNKDDAKIEKKPEKNEEKKSKSNEKSSKDYKRDDKKDDKKDDKHRKSSSSSSREKERTSSKHHSSSKDKDKKDSRSSSSYKDKEKNKVDKEKIDKDNKSSKHKEKSDKEKSKTEKEKSDKDKSKSDKTKTEKEHANKAEKEKSEKEKSEKEKSDRSKDDKSKSKTDKYKSDKDKHKSERDKSNKDKDKSDKDKSSKEKDKYKDKSYKSKEKSDKDKEKSSKEKSSRDRSSSRKDSKEKKEEIKESNKEVKEKLKDDGKEVGREKSRSSSSSSKQNSSKDKKPSTPKKESSSHKEKSSPGDFKYKSSSEKGKKDEGTFSSNKKDKDESKKKSKDDHYSHKIKKSERRSTDRDSNDGQSSKNVFNSYSESTSSRSGNNSQDYSSSSITSGSGDSGNSDQTETVHAVSNGPTETAATTIPAEPTKLLHELPKVRYIKPKFAMNFEEARKIMKIRKQLAMLERQNQLSLAKIEVPIQNGITNGEANDDNTVEDAQNEVENKEEIKPVDISEEKENINTSRCVDDTVIQAAIDKKSVNKVDNVKEVLCADKCIQDPKMTVSKIEGRDISKENWEALEAKLAQVMSEVDYNSYDSDDDFEFHGYSSIDIIPKKLIDVNRDLVKKTEEEILKNEGDTNLQQSHVQQSRLHNPYILNSDEQIVSNVFNNSTNSNSNVQDSPPSSSEKTYTREILNANVKNKQLSEALSDADCRFLEEPSCDEENYLRGLKMLISRMEIDVEQYAENLSNNIWPSRRGTKRKLEEHVDIKNNNKSLYMETVKKRRGSASSVTVTPIAGKKRLSNSTDITPAEHFSLPLSPAESDKSNERKDEDLVIPIKQKRIMREYTQRYSSDDLYKPRPVFGGRRKKQS